MHGHSASSVSTNAISDIFRNKATQLVATTPELVVNVSYALDAVLTATVTLQSLGPKYDNSQWDAWGPTAGFFDPPIQPIHDPPFTVDMMLQHMDCRLRRVFIFNTGGRGWYISTIEKPELFNFDSA